MIQYYGAFAAALSFIIHTANKRRRPDERIKGTVELYRGLKMQQQDIDTFRKGANIHLTGYTSSSRDKQMALSFAFEDI